MTRADDDPGPPTGLWFAAILLVAANLRPVISSVPPLVDAIAAAYGLSAAAAGALTTLPVLCMGLFAPVAPLAARRLGESTVLGGAVAAIAAGAGLRAVGGLAGLYAGTALAGTGIAVAGTLLPSLVRTRTPHRVGPVTGLYSAAIIGGALLGSAITEPLRAWLDLSPQGVLGLWAVPAILALLAVLAWLGRPEAPGGPVELPWRSGAAWLGTALMGAQSLLFYATLAWLAPLYTRQGMTAGQAGILLGVFSAAQVVTAIAAPALAHRRGDLRPWLGAAVGASTLGLLLVALAPDGFAAAPWLWAALLGLGMGATLSLTLTVLTQLAPSARAASAYTGMAFFVGYLFAAAGPVTLGTLIDRTGGYVTPFLALAAFGVATATLGVAAAGAARKPVPSRAVAGDDGAHA